MGLAAVKRPSRQTPLPSSAIRYAILGPLLLERGASNVTPHAAKQRALLAVLLLRRGEIVSVDTLLDSLWVDELPSSAHKLVQIYVSQLRRMLPADRLVTRAPGYRLDVFHDELDVDRFERLLGEGRRALANDVPHEAAATLARALDLWRGPPLADFSYEPFAQTAIARLEELRLGAIEDRIEADLGCGRHHALVADLTSLVAEHPLNERFARQLMVSLFRSGRQAEALRVAHDTRRALIAELGVGPGPDLTGLESAIMRNDGSPALGRVATTKQQDATSRLDGTTSTTSADNDAHRARSQDARTSQRSEHENPGLSQGSRLVGRDEELAQLRQAWARSVREPISRLLTIVGEAGIGKSRLADVFTSSLAADTTVLTGRCHPHGAGMTFSPLTEMLAQAAERYALTPEALVSDDHDGRRVSDAIASLESADPAPGSARDAAWGVRRVFRAFARRAPLVLVFEDIHWAEPMLLDVIEHIVEQTHDVPLFVLCLARPELSETRPGWDVPAPRRSTIVLPPLTGGDAEALIDAVPASVSDVARTKALEMAEGNPLFLEQIAAMLGETPPDAQLWVPETVHAVLAARLARLGPAERELLERAAVVGRIFSWSCLLTLLPARARHSAARHLAALVRKRLVLPGGSSGDFRFAHALIRDASYRGLSRPMRARLHRRTAAWLAEDLSETRAGERDELIGYHLESAAHLLRQTGTPTDASSALAEEAFKRLSAAGLRAARRRDDPAAANLLGRAAALLDAADTRRLELLPTLARVLREAGDLTAADAVLSEAMERATAVGRPQLKAQALVERAQLDLFLGKGAASALADAASAIEIFSEHGDIDGQYRAWRVRGFVHRGLLDNRACLQSFERALELAQRLGDRVAESDTVHNICWALIDLGADDDAEIRATRLLEWAASTGDERLECDALAPLAYLDARKGRVAAARDQVNRIRRILEERGHRMALLPSAFLAGWVETLAGDFAAAESHYRWGYARSQAMGEGWWLRAHAGRLAEVLEAQGRQEEAEGFRQEVVTRRGGLWDLSRTASLRLDSGQRKTVR